MLFLVILRRPDADRLPKLHGFDRQLGWGVDCVRDLVASVRRVGSWKRMNRYIVGQFDSDAFVVSGVEEQLQGAQRLVPKAEVTVNRTVICYP